MISTQASRFRHLASIAALLLSVRWHCVAARAEDNTSAAKARYAADLQHFNLAEYKQALAEFKEAYRNKPHPVFLFNSAKCHTQEAWTRL